MQPKYIRDLPEPIRESITNLMVAVNDAAVAQRALNDANALVLAREDELVAALAAAGIESNTNPKNY